MLLARMENVSFSYPNGVSAVEELSLDIYGTEALAIIGQNGAGKTTAVKMLNGLLRPSVGDVTIGQKNTKSFTTAEISKDVGYVFQNPDDQIFNSTVLKEVGFTLKVQKFSAKEIENRSMRALELTRLVEMKDSNPFDLPIQTRRFVAIASVIAMDPKIFIFDEPTAGQDINGNKVLSELIHQLVLGGKTVVTISHDMDFVIRNFPRTVIMADKRKITEGSTHDLFQDQKSLSEAMLKLPPIGLLCKEIGLEGPLLPAELVNVLREKKNVRDS